MFDEDVFPFFNLHFNAGARLRSELVHLHPTLLNPIFSDYGGGRVEAQPANDPPNTTNDFSGVHGENQEANAGAEHILDVPHTGTGHEADPRAAEE